MTSPAGIPAGMQTPLATNRRCASRPPANRCCPCRGKSRRLAVPASIRTSVARRSQCGTTLRVVKDDAQQKLAIGRKPPEGRTPTFQSCPSSAWARGELGFEAAVSSARDELGVHEAELRE